MSEDQVAQSSVSSVADVRGLHVSFDRGGERIHALRGVDLAIAPGEIVGLVGESGSGKTMLGLSLLGLLPPIAQIQGSVRVDDVDLNTADMQTRRRVRRRALGAVFQDPMSSLNPTMPIGRQVIEVAGSRVEAIRLLEAAGIADATRRLKEFPHQLSGGLRQRVMLAIALAGEPKLIIADRGCAGGENVAVTEPYSAPIEQRSRLLPARSDFRALPLGEQSSLMLLAALLVLALVGPFLVVDPTIAAGQPFDSPSWHHLFGTDDIGQDILARVVYGLRASWFSALGVIASGVVIGGAIGLVAGTRGGWMDTVLMRFTDTFLSLPGPVLAIAVVAALGPSLFHTTVAVAVVWWPWYARLVRGEVRALAVRPHVDAARLSGISTVRLMLHHLLPGAFPPVIITASLDIQNLVLTLAGLSFLGLGSPPPSPELGAMTARGLEYLVGNPWIPLIPAMGVFILAAAANLAGDGIRDLFEQRP